MEIKVLIYVKKIRSKLSKYIDVDVLNKYINELYNQICKSNDKMQKVASSYFISKVSNGEISYDKLKDNYSELEEKIILFSIIDLICENDESTNSKIEKYCNILDISLLDYFTLISEIESKNLKDKEQSLKLN